MPMPDGTTGYTAGPDQVSRAALFGGTTTLIDFAVRNAGLSIREAVERRDTDSAGKRCCDYAYHVRLQGELPAAVVAQIPEMVHFGDPTAKILPTARPPIP